MLLSNSCSNGIPYAGDADDELDGLFWQTTGEDLGTYGCARGGNGGGIDGKNGG